MHSHHPAIWKLFFFLVLFFSFFETRFLWLAVLAVLDLAIVDQADLVLTEIHLPFIFSQTTLKNQKWSPAVMAQIATFGRQRQADLCEFEANLFLQSMFQVPLLLGLLHRETLSLKK